MACSDNGLSEIAAAIRSLAAAAQSTATATVNCCGDGSGGEGQHSGPLDDISVDEPGVGDPPPGFESWEQYFTNKCNVADYILGQLTTDVGNMRLVNLIGITLVSLIPILIGLLISPVPGDEIAVIGGVLLASLAFGTAILDSWYDTLVNHREELRCALYEANSPAGAESAFNSTFADAYDTDNPGVPYALQVKMAMDSMLGAAQANSLFTLETELDLPDADCSMCGGFELTIRGDYGSIEGEFPTWLISSEPAGEGFNRLAVEREDGQCFVVASATVTAWSTPYPYVGNSGVAIQDETAGEINPVPVGDVENAGELESYLEVHQMRWFDVAALDTVVPGDAAFTIEVTVSAC